MPCIAFFATQEIGTGEEVTYDYGKSPYYWWRLKEKETGKCSKINKGNDGSANPKGSLANTQASEKNQQSSSTVERKTEDQDLHADNENMELKMKSSTPQQEIDDDREKGSQEMAPKTQLVEEYQQSTSTVDKENEIPDENAICENSVSMDEDHENSNTEVHVMEMDIDRKSSTPQQEIDDDREKGSQKMAPKTQLVEEYQQSTSTVDKENEIPDVNAICENSVSMDEDHENSNTEVHVMEMDIDRKSSTTQQEIDDDREKGSQEMAPKTQLVEEYQQSTSTVDKEHETPDENAICENSVSMDEDHENSNTEVHVMEMDIERKSSTTQQELDDDREKGSQKMAPKTQLVEEYQQSTSTVDKENGFPDENAICENSVSMDEDHENSILSPVGKHYKIEELCTNDQSSTLMNDDEKTNPELDHEIDTAQDSSTSGEEIDNDMDEDYNPGPDLSESEGDSDCEPQSTARGGSYGELTSNQEVCHDHSKVIKARNMLENESSLRIEREGSQSEQGDNTLAKDHYQNITIQPTSNTGGKRTWDKKYFCLFCDKGYAKLPQHLMVQHKDEPQVIAIEIEKDPKVRKEKLTKLRNMGNHKHNCDVLRNGEGVLIVGYRPPRVVSPKDYGPCCDCLVYLIRTNLWKHSCIAKGINTEQEAVQRKRPAMAAKLMVPTPKNISPAVHKLLLGLTDDDIGRAVKGDTLLVELAKYEFLEHGHDRDQHADIRATLRRMGRLLLQLRRDTKQTGDLSSFLDVAHFRAVVDAARQVGCFDERTHRYLKASTAIKIGYTLIRLALIEKGKAMENEDIQARTRAQDFHELCKLNWTHEVSRHAHRTLHENKRNKVRVLPLTEDIMRLSEHLKEQTRKCVQELQERMNDATWATLNKVILARIITFNRRRSGESAKIKIEEYKERPSPTGDKVVMAGLSKIEEELCRSLQRIEIRGKRGSNVPVLLTEEMVQAIDLLIERRKEAGVHSGNEFLFARAKYGSLDHIRGCDCLRELASEAKCKNPTSMRSTPLRKQIATVSQIINLKENELDILAKFLGHDIRVHREFYRLPQETLQVAKVSKLLLASEQGLNGLEGKTLDEIDVSVDEGK